MTYRLTRSIRAYRGPRAMAKAIEAMAAALNEAIMQGRIQERMDASGELTARPGDLYAKQLERIERAALAAARKIR